MAAPISWQDLSGQFLELLSAIKLQHWYTRSYVAHKELGHLYDGLDEALDRFMECMMGAGQVNSQLNSQLNGNPARTPSAGGSTSQHNRRNVKGLTSLSFIRDKTAVRPAALARQLGQWIQEHLTADDCQVAHACRETPALGSIRDDIVNIINRTRYLISMTD